MPLLIILDFDGTVTNGNTHNRVVEGVYKSGGNLSEEEQWELFRSVKPLKSASAWKQVFETLLANGHHVAIASFNNYGKFIERYLREVIGLSCRDIEKIVINSWFPSNPSNTNKNKHIEQIIRKIGFRGEPSTTVLVDDSPKNISGGRERGYTVISASTTDEAPHIKHILELSVNLNTPAKPPAIQNEETPGSNYVFTKLFNHNSSNTATKQNTGTKQNSGVQRIDGLIFPLISIPPGTRLTLECKNLPGHDFKI